MKTPHFACRRLFAGLIAFVICTVALTGCSGKGPDTAKITDAYIDGFTRFYEQGNEYTDLGLQLQADYAYGWAASSVSAMRYCIDCLLSMKSEGQTPNEPLDGRMSDWDKIASLN